MNDPLCAKPRSDCPKLQPRRAGEGCAVLSGGGTFDELTSITVSSSLQQLAAPQRKARDSLKLAPAASKSTHAQVKSIQAPAKLAQARAKSIKAFPKLTEAR
jgi:hypothetical protein